MPLQLEVKEGMKTNIYECYTSLKVEDLENLKIALLNFYQINRAF